MIILLKWKKFNHEQFDYLDCYEYFAYFDYSVQSRKVGITFQYHFLQEFSNQIWIVANLSHVVLSLEF